MSAFNARIVIGLHSFKTDIIKSIRGPTGFLSHLTKDAAARAHFAKCMKLYIHLRRVVSCRDRVLRRKRAADDVLAILFQDRA